MAKERKGYLDRLPLTPYDDPALHEQRVKAARAIMFEAMRLEALEG